MQPHDVFLSRDAPSFDALSYVWGSSDERQKIRCNGKDLHITANLYQALQQVRCVINARVIWADQICINQQDPRERGHQVALMGSIFSRAHKVLACLGGTHEEGRQLSAFMKTLAKKMEAEVWKYGTWWRIENPYHHADWLFEGDGFRTLQRIFRLAYFGRTWILQELGLAKMPVVLVGKFELSWTILIECSLFLNIDSRKFDPNKFLSIPPARRVALADWGLPRRHWFISRIGDCDFIKVLDAARHLKASDDRDRVYAFLGHPAARMRDGTTVIYPDYTIDMNSCLHNFAKQ